MAHAQSGRPADPTTWSPAKPASAEAAEQDRIVPGPGGPDDVRDGARTPAPSRQRRPGRTTARPEQAGHAGRASPDSRVPGRSPANRPGDQGRTVDDRTQHSSRARDASCTSRSRAATTGALDSRRVAVLLVLLSSAAIRRRHQTPAFAGPRDRAVATGTTWCGRTDRSVNRDRRHRRRRIGVHELARRPRSVSPWARSTRPVSESHADRAPGRDPSAAGGVGSIPVPCRYLGAITGPKGYGPIGSLASHGIAEFRLILGKS